MSEQKRQLDRSGEMMRYWSYNEQLNEIDSHVVAVSDDDILDMYWNWWYGKMCEKFGKEIVDRDYTKQDCIDDWVVVHWAWESE
jgi:hypothetical protein